MSVDVHLCSSLLAVKVLLISLEICCSAQVVVRGVIDIISVVTFVLMFVLLTVYCLGFLNLHQKTTK